MTAMQKYPGKIVLIAVAQMAVAIILGALIFTGFGGWWGVGYIVISLSTIFVSVRLRCAFCCYWGKRCFSGLGLLAPFLTHRGRPKDFRRPANLWPVAILSFTLMLLPIAAGISLVIGEFMLTSLVILLAYVFLAVVPGFFLRKHLFCKGCRQGKLGCPAWEGLSGK
jgi:hypothetical protein